MASSLEMDSPERIENVTTTLNGKQGSIIDNYTIVPTRKGKYPIQPLTFSYFDPEAKIYGIDTNEIHLEEALSMGLIDYSATYQDLSIADVVIVSIPVDVMVSVLPKVLDVVNDDAVVLDAGSTKALICSTLEHHPKRRNFLACHPTAGTEF